MQKVLAIINGEKVINLFAVLFLVNIILIDRKEIRKKTAFKYGANLFCIYGKTQ